MTYAATAGANRRNGTPAPFRPAPNPHRERTIAKLAVLKAAAQFGASRPELKSADVLRIADTWLAWVER